MIVVHKLREARRCHRCNAAAWWRLWAEEEIAIACSSHLGSSIVQAERRGLAPRV